MEVSIFLAKVFSIYFIITGLGLAINIKSVNKLLTDFFKNKGLQLTVGALATIAGTILVLIHNIWETDWRIFITIIAWITLSKGVVNLLAPDWTAKQAKKLTNKTALSVGIMIAMIIGLYLAWFGFIA